MGRFSPEVAGSGVAVLPDPVSDPPRSGGAPPDLIPVADLAVVVPTVGRSSLGHLLDALATDRALTGATVVLVDDRPGGGPLPTPGHPGLDLRLRRSDGAGPAAARNTGWTAVAAPWVVFLDDDVVPAPTWGRDLRRDLAAAGPGTVGVQGRLSVPAPVGRRPTDWERQTAGLAAARWATADMAYRRSALVAAGGFDPRFRRAFREDSDLALRALRHGALVPGRRRVIHPVRPAPWWASVARQRGNADDRLMARLHGSDWRRRAGAPRGRLHRHVAVTAAAAGTAAALVGGWRRTALAAAAGWAVGTVELTAARVRPGPRDGAEVAAMAVTSIAIPPAATMWSAWGLLHRPSPRPRARAVLFDRDGTLVHDVPYNGDPDRVRPVAAASRALARLRVAGVPVGIVSNQSGVARGLLSVGDVWACHRRLAELVGPFATVRFCVHGPDEACGCRKPAPGLVAAAVADMGLDPADVVVVGDIGSDVEAARRAGARSLLVPNGETRAEEVEAAPAVARHLDEAVDMVLGGLV